MGPAGGIVIPDRVTLLADVAEIVSRSHDLNETLSNVVELVAKRLDADACSLYLCGTDQGFLGIVGAMLSGISIANARVLAQGA